MQNELTQSEQMALGFLKNARAAKSQDTADWHLRAAVRHADKAGATLEEIETKAAVIAAMQTIEAPAVKAAPVCSGKAIRRFFAICKSAGIDTADESHVQGALSVFFARRIESCKELTTDNWLAAADAIEAGRLIF